MIPEGRPLPDDAWRARHRMIVGLLALQAIALVVFGTVRGYGFVHSLTEGMPIAAAAFLGSRTQLGRELRSSIATLGLVMTSAILVHLSGGTIEAHFHFFVMIGVIALYQSWMPFLLALGFVVAHHGVVGVLDPDAVYNHAAALANPWRWAAIHGVFVLAASAAQLVSWRFSENARSSFELILASTAEGVIGTDTDGRVTFLNPEASRMLAIAEADAIGRPVLAVLNPTDEDGAPYPAERCAIRETMRAGQTHTSSEMFLGHADRFAVEVTAKPITRHGEIAGLVITFRDIGERRAADIERRTTLSLLEATLESTADGILVVDTDGRISRFNRKFVEMWRIPDDVIASQDDDRAIGFVLSQLTDPDGFLAKVRELYARPDAESHDLLEFKDGRVFERYSQPQRVGGEGVGRVWSFRDVTEARRLDEMKDGFLSAISHELRTPLTSVLGYALTLQQRQESLSADERRAMIDRVGTNALKLQRLLTDILDLDRLGRGILEPRRQPTDVGALVRRLLDETEAYTDRSVTLADDGIIANVDPAKVERIAENLLTNAIRHTPRDARLWVTVRAHDGGVLIAVEDDGPGVPEEHRAAIFESFRQGPIVAAHSPGVGIGLSLVARFAELHGGRAWVEERTGGGASFRVYLPDHGPAVDGDATSSSPARMASRRTPAADRATV